MSVKRSTIAIRNLVLVATICSLLLPGQPDRVRAQSPDAVTGIASAPLGCLAAGPGENGEPVSSAGVVNLTWNGTVEQARLIVTVAGTEAAHTIRVNGQPVGVTPIFPDGQFCTEGEVAYIDVPPALVVQGDNQVELTGDALPGDGWSASSIRLEVLGRFAEAGAAGQDMVQATTAAPTTINFVNSFDGTTQQARIQVPTGYNGATPRPLLLYIHPRSRDMYAGEDDGLNLAVDAQGWFYGAPQLHGAWPGTDQYPVPNPPGQYAYASVQSQYDVIGTLQYLVSHYNIDPNRIYLYANSMGSQVGEVVLAKFPSLFAAAFFNKGPSDWTKWYQQTQQMIAKGYAQSWHRQWMERECYLMIDGVPTPRTPAQNPYCYESRSSLPYARNLTTVPITLTHSISDILVPASHSTELQNAVNSLGPAAPVGFYPDTVVGPTCTDQGKLDPTPYYHCMVDSHQTVINFLSRFTRNARPLSLNLATTQAQVFYWLKFGSIGSSRWAYVRANANLDKQAVTAAINAATPLVLSFNLGTTPVQEIIPHPGVGLPATTYLVKEQGRAGYLANYTSGYLDVPLNSTGAFTLTIAALDVRVSANPATKPAGQPLVTTITVVVKDKLGQTVPDQTPVVLTTTAGQFPGGGTTYNGSTTGGQVTVSLSLGANDAAAQVVAQVGNATGSVTVAAAAGTATPTPTPTSTPVSTPTPTSTPTATTVPANDLIFADGFESGSYLNWSGRLVDGGDLYVAPAAKLQGNYGVGVQIDDNNALLLRDDSPNGEKRYRARFYFDPNSIAMAQGDNHVLFRGYTGDWPAVVEILFRYYNGRYQVIPGILNDGTTWRHAAWFDVADGPHFFEIDWQAATAAGANDGALSFWIDGVLYSHLTGIDNDTRVVDRVRLGPSFGIDTGTRGTYFLDGFEARRTTYIGPDPAAPVILGQAANPATLRQWSESDLSAEDHQPTLELEETGSHRTFLPQLER